MRLDYKLMRFSAAMSSSVLTMGVLIFLGYQSGQWLDGRFGTAPLFSIVLMLGGVLAGLAWILWVANKSKP